MVVNGTEDLEDEMEVVNIRCDPADRLNSRVVMVADGFAGMPLWMIGLCFVLLLVADMVVPGKRRDTWHLCTCQCLYVHVGMMSDLMGAVGQLTELVDSARLYWMPISVYHLG